MKLGVFSHCTIDEIHIDENVFERPGGPACYCGLTAKNMGFSVELATKYGPDFPLAERLRHEMKLHDPIAKKMTTRFRLEINDAERMLWVKNTCDEIPYKKLDVDCILISPVFDEISKTTLDKLKNDANLVALDPQGFLRRVGLDHSVFFEKTDINLADIDILKSDPNEVFNLTGFEPEEGILVLHKKIEHLLYTNKRDVSLFYKNRKYSIQLPNMDLYDTSGVGDIFTATYCCTMIKEKDAIWALSFACGAAQAALESKEIGLDKVPPKAAIESNASYFYNTIKFTDI